MRDFALGACSSGRLMKPTTISTSCRSGQRLCYPRSHREEESFTLDARPLEHSRCHPNVLPRHVWVAVRLPQSSSR